jgi:hypothetical protein
MKKGNVPELTSEGTSGVYIIKNDIKDAING